MHGSIFTSLKEYIESKHSSQIWNAILERAKLTGKRFIALDTYSDEEMQAILKAASHILKISPNNLLEDFGEFLFPILANIYGIYIDRTWRTFDLLLHTESTMHAVVKRRNPDAEPPKLEITTQAPDELKIIYTSPRKLCFLGKGLIKGIAKHYKERVEIKEYSCMHRKDKSCEMSIRIKSN